MSNTLLTISMITNEALRVLENNLSFTRGVNREYDSSFGNSGAKIGNTLNIRKPARFVGRSGTTLSVENYTETSTPLVLNNQFGVDVQFTSADLTLSLDDFSNRFIKPAVARVANKVDEDGLALYKKVANCVGTPGSVPTTLKTYLQAMQKMQENAAPMDDQNSIVMTPAGNVEIVDALKGLFQSSTQISEQYMRGRMGTAIGAEWSIDQNIKTHTIGIATGTPLVDGASQTGSTLVTDGWTASQTGILKEGDVFTIAGVYAVNPQSKQSTGSLQQFVVTADANSGAGAGAATLSIYPAITTSGAFQTVTASPANNAAITVFGTGGTATPQMLAYHKDAFTLGCADLQLPRGVDMAARASSKESGLSVRMVRAYDINEDTFPCRLDILYGWAALYPELACRIAS